MISKEYFLIGVEYLEGKDDRALNKPQTDPDLLCILPCLALRLLICCNISR